MSSIHYSPSRYIGTAWTWLAIVGVLHLMIQSATLRAQSIHPTWAEQLSVRDIGSDHFSRGRNGASRITQLALTDGPTPSERYLYMSSNERGIRRALYDVSQGKLVPNSLETVASDITGLGVGFHHDTLYATELYERRGLSFSRIWKLDQLGEGERTAIVQGIPRDDHGVNHLQIQGDTLYVGIGVRTRNGVLQTWSGDNYGESAYGGTIAMIDDLNAVGDEENAAGFFPEAPSASVYAELIRGTDPRGAMPWTTSEPGKLRIHSSGTRNPFGLAIDGDGQLWFTNNFHRVDNDDYDRSNLTATADGDSFSGDGFQNDIHDQMFRAMPFADYGYRNGNWQDGNPLGNTEALDAGFFQSENRQASFTFDNYVDPVASNENDRMNPAYNQDYDNDDPVGLGPSSSTNGFDFYQGNDFPLPLHKDAFAARWTASNSDGTGPDRDSLTFQDVVSVDHQTGSVQRIAIDFANPLDVIDDGHGRLIIADHGGSLHVIEAAENRDSHVVSWNGPRLGNWSDASAWTAEALPPGDPGLVPDQWGSARYQAIVDGPEINTIVRLDQDVEVENLVLSQTLEVLGDNVLVIQDLEMTDTARLIFRSVRAAAQQFAVTEQSELAGTLQLNSSDAPPPTEPPLATEIIHGSEIVGTFDRLVVGGMTADQDGHVGAGHFYWLQQTSETVTLMRMQTLPGDANLDQVFDSSDLVAVFVAGEYEDGIDGNSRWTEGDWNGDSDFTSSDLIAAFNIGHYEAGNAAAHLTAAAIPEPSSAVLLATTCLTLAVARLRAPLRPRSAERG